MTDDKNNTVRVQMGHTAVTAVTHNGNEIPACTCQLAQLDDADIVNGRIPPDLPDPQHTDRTGGGGYR